MSPQDGGIPVQPALFQPLERYANDLINGKVQPEDEIASEILTFCQYFFQQFLLSVSGVEITEIDEESEEAVRRRLAYRHQGLTTPEQRLWAMFHDLCDMWPDISQGTYSGSQSTFRWLHRTYMPRLLLRIKDWADTNGYTEITTRALAVQRLFAAASEELSAEDTRATAEEDRKDVMRLVELDYSRTADFITGLMQRQAGMRSLAWRRRFG